MTTLASRLDTVIRAVASSIIGVSIGSRDDKSTWRIDFAPEAIQVERDAAAAVVASFDAAAVEAAENTERVALETLAAGARADGVFAALRTATGPQIATFVNNTFPDMNAQQRAVMKLLVHLAALSLRRGG